MLLAGSECIELDRAIRLGKAYHRLSARKLAAAALGNPLNISRSSTRPPNEHINVEYFFSYSTVAPTTPYRSRHEPGGRHRIRFASYFEMNRES